MRKEGVIMAVVVEVVVVVGIMVMVSRGCLRASLGVVGSRGKGNSSLGLEGGGIILVEVGSGGEGAAKGEGIGD